MDKEIIKRALLSIALLVTMLVATIVIVYMLANYFLYMGAAWAFGMLFWVCWLIAGEILSHPWVSGGENGKETV